MNAKRYTNFQVLCGLREAWQGIGVDDPFDAGTRIDIYMKAEGTWDEIDFADLFRELEEFFGFSCSDGEWTELFGFDVAECSLAEWERKVAPHLTFGALARFIAERAPVVASFDPIVILGRQCAPAGVFTGIQRVANHACPGQRRFSPSARLIDVMRGNDLDHFWTQLRWMTEHSIPELPAFWRGANAIVGCWSVLAVLGGLAATWATANLLWIVSTVLAAVSAYLLASAYKRFANPLPPHIVTFRDLAMLIANTRSTMTAR